MNESDYFIYMTILLTILVVLMVIIAGYVIFSERRERTERFERELRSSPSYPPASGLEVPEQKKNKTISELQSPKTVYKSDPVAKPTETPTQPQPVTSPTESMTTEEPRPTSSFEEKVVTPQYVNPTPSLPDPVAKAVAKVTAKKPPVKRAPRKPTGATAMKTPPKAKPVPKNPQM